MANPDDPGAVSRRASAIWLACWIVWTTLVLVRYFVPPWRSPADDAAFPSAGRMVEDLVGCAVLGGGALLTVLLGRTIGRRIALIGSLRRANVGAVALIGAGALAVPWFAVRAHLRAALSPVGMPGLPVFGEATARGADGAIGAMFVTFAALSLGSIVVGVLRLPPLSWLERAVMSVSIGFGALAYGSLALAMAGGYRPTPVAILIAAALISGGLHRWFGADDQPHGLAAPVPRPSGLEYAWVALALLACSFGLVAALAPEVEFDALWYHLYLPVRWLEAGRPVDVIQEFPSLYPLTWELVFGAGMVLGGVIAAKLLHAICLALLASIVIVACRRWWPHASPYVAVGLLCTTPTVLWEAGTAYVDLSLALFAAVGSYALARFAESGTRAWLVVAAIEFGLACATKHLGLVLLVVAAISVAAGWWQGRLTRNPLPGLAVLVLVAVTLPLPWYLRSWRASGNPFFPELYGVFGGGPPERWDAVANAGLDRFKARFGRHDGARSLLLLPWDATMHGASFGGSLGPLWLILLPACVGRGRSARPARLVAAATAAYLLVWASPISSYQMRFLVPAVPALALLGAEGARRLSTAADRVAPRAGRVLHAALLCVAVLNLPVFVAWHEADRVGWSGWLTHVLREAPLAVVTGRESERSYLTRTVPSYRAWEHANAHLSPEAVVLTFSAGDQLYSRPTRIPHDSVLARPAVWTARSGADARAALERLGVTHVLFDVRELPRLSQNGSPIALPDVQRACRAEYEDRRFRLCRMDYGRVTGGDNRSGPR